MCHGQLYQQRMKKAFDKNVKPRVFREGDLLRRYIHDPSHVVQVDDVQVRDNLTVETSPMRIEDRELKQLRGKEIALVKVAWGGPAGGNVTWELESQMKESYPELFA
ncbi:hypothetical protein KIW84_024085 [Lathyrus oleraceus]|uniref:Retrotransposon gag protein n=1 Tax=Pisum sativum TaxID=3888 RepID=A0A9D5B7A7_PEA|nr:hypothetical protein KIW84_024085 [Pisum sativum]